MMRGRFTEKGSKSKKLGTWTHDASGIAIDYFITGTRFTCVCLEESLDAPEATVLRAKVFDKLEHWMQMDWYPVIEVEVEEAASSYSYSRRQNREGDSMKLAVARYYISRSPAGVVKKVAWEVDEAHRKAQMNTYNVNGIGLTKLPLGAPYKCGDDQFLIDHTDEIWESLQSIIQGIGKLRDQIQKLVSSRDGVKRLTTGGSKLLQLNAPK